MDLFHANVWEYLFQSFFFQLFGHSAKIWLLAAAAATKKVEIAISQMFNCFSIKI